jgi:thiamine-phosphate pyrophosphorylase
MKGYYFITDKNLSRAGNRRDVERAVQAGITAVQYREKEASTREMLNEATALRELCRGKALFLVNDRVDVALAVDADGVHIGQDDMPYAAARRLLGRKKIIGVTVHTPAEARAAEQAGADYVGVSPIFATATKPDAGEPAGITLIKSVKKDLKVPVIAIGGITLLNAAAVVGAGADGLCAISAVVAQEDVTAAARRFQELFEII